MSREEVVGEVVMAGTEVRISVFRCGRIPGWKPRDWERWDWSLVLRSETTEE